jgi:hypothetical protein
MDSPEQEKDNEEQEKTPEDTASAPGMKIPIPVWIGYGVLTIVTLIMYHSVFLSGEWFLFMFFMAGISQPLWIFWIYATGILMIMQSASLIRNKEDGGKVFSGYVLRIMGIAIVVINILFAIIFTMGF